MVLVLVLLMVISDSVIVKEATPVMLLLLLCRLQVYRLGETKKTKKKIGKMMHFL